MTDQDDCPDVLVIRLPRDLSDDGSQELQRVLEPVLGRETVQLALDMSDVVDLSGASLSRLVLVQKHARKVGGDVRLFAVPPRVMRLLESEALDRIFESFATEQEAVASFSE